MGSNFIGWPGICWGMLLTAGPVAAQESTEDRIAAWIVKAWNPRESLPKDRCFRVRWALENRFIPPADEIKRLRAEVKAALDHPQKKELAIFEGRLLGQKDSLETDVWIDPSSGKWRLNLTNIYLGQSEYSDFARQGDSHWCLTPGQLIVGSPSAPEPGYDYSQAIEMNLSHLSWFMSAGMSAGYTNHLAAPVVRLKGKEWTAETRDDTRGLLFRAKGVWYDESKSGSATEVYVRQQRGQQDDWEARFVSTGRRHISEIDFWVPDRVEAWQGTPLKLDRVYRFTGFEFIETAEVDALVRMPDFAGSDPIRGKITITSILDLRQGSRGYQKLTEAGTEFIPIEQTEAAKHYRRLRWYGWISAGVVGAALVVLRFRRRMISHSLSQESIA